MGKCLVASTVSGTPQSAFIGAGASGAENAVTFGGDAGKTGIPDRVLQPESGLAC